MLKYIGDFDKLKDYGFEKCKGINDLYITKKLYHRVMEDGFEYNDEVCVFSKDRVTYEYNDLLEKTDQVIYKKGLIVWNDDSAGKEINENIDVITNLIKDGLVIKETI